MIQLMMIIRSELVVTCTFIHPTIESKTKSRWRFAIGGGQNQKLIYLDYQCKMGGELRLYVAIKNVNYSQVVLLILQHHQQQQQWQKHKLWGTQSNLRSFFFYLNLDFHPLSFPNVCFSARVFPMKNGDLPLLGFANFDLQIFIFSLVRH